VTRKNPDMVANLITEALAIEAEDARDAGSLGFVVRAMAQATLPHRRIDGSEFTRRNGNFTLTILAPSKVGLPYGSIPRLALSWLATEAVRTRSREIDLGDTLSGFMGELGLVPTGGRWGSIGRLKSQVHRLFSATISARIEDDSRTVDIGYRVADQATFWWNPVSPGQGSLWRSSVKLSETFYAEIISHPVPVDVRALRALKRSPLAIDIYVWLTWRLPILRRPTLVPWEGLAAQFGAGYARQRDFKAAFVDELRRVAVIYPDARVEVEADGLLLLPSRPHVARIEAR
jgi:Plasmid encoded RepA protein